MEVHDQSDYSTDPLGPEHAAEERRVARARTLAAVTFWAIVTPLAIVARCNAIDNYTPPKPKFVCTTIVDTGETLWGIAGQIEGSGASNAKVDATREDVAFNNGLLYSVHPRPGTKLKLTKAQCDRLEKNNPDQVTGAAE